MTTWKHVWDICEPGTSCTEIYNRDMFDSDAAGSMMMLVAAVGM